MGSYQKFGCRRSLTRRFPNAAMLIVGDGDGAILIEKVEDGVGDGDGGEKDLPNHNERSECF